jgi:hypothetical protein
MELVINGRAAEVKATGQLQDWDDDGVIVVGLAKGTAERFLSNDRDETLEGLIAFGLNGQDTAVEWKATSQRPTAIQFNPTLLYAGRANRLDKDGEPIEGEKLPIQLGCEMIESDEDIRKKLDKWSDVLKAGAGFAGLVPGYGAPIGAGLGLARSVLNLFKDRADDDTELAVRTTLMPESNEISIVRNRQGFELKLFLDVHHLKHKGPRKGGLKVAEVKFTINDEIRVVKPKKFVLMFELICGAGAQRRQFSFQHVLDQADQGVGAAGGDTVKRHFESVREMAGMDVFRGEMGYGVPVRLSARLMQEDKTIEAISALAAESGTFAAEFLPPGGAALVTKVAKAETTFRTFVLPLLAGKNDFDLGTFDGYLFPDAPPNFPYLVDIPPSGQRITLTSNGKDGEVELTLEVF